MLLPAIGCPSSPHPPRSINSRRGSGFLPPRAWPIQQSVRRSEWTTPAFQAHFTGTAVPNSLIAKTGSVVTSPQNHLSSAFYFSSSSFSCCWGSPSLLSKNDSVGFLSWQMQSRKHRQQTVAQYKSYTCYKKRNEPYNVLTRAFKNMTRESSKQGRYRTPIALPFAKTWPSFSDWTGTGHKKKPDAAILQGEETPREIMPAKSKWSYWVNTIFLLDQ